MHYLIYLSSAKRLFSDQDLEDILMVSRRNNSRSDITGLLLYHDGMIMQMLEGEYSAIHQLYDKITLDDRHTGIMKMTEGTEEGRIFGDWTMGFRRMSEKDWSVFTEGLSLDPRSLVKDATSSATEHPEMQMLFNAFVKVNERSI
jgi:hypothetical protein